MTNRLQLSLIIDDNDLYNNLLIPLKKSRELHQLCIKLFTAYYYDSNVRALVDEGNNGVVEDPIMDAISSLRNNLAMQTFLGSDLAQVLESGAEDIANIANGGTVEVSSEDSNLKFQFKKNSAGNTNVKLLTENSNTESTTQQEPDAIFLINYLAKQLNIDLSGAYKTKTSENVEVAEAEVKAEVKPEVKPEVKSEVGREPEVEVNTEIGIEPEVSVEPEVNIEPEVKSEVGVDIDDFKAIEDISGVVELPLVEEADASSSISELLGSLF